MPTTRPLLLALVMGACSSAPRHETTSPTSTGSAKLQIAVDGVSVDTAQTSMVVDGSPPVAATSITPWFESDEDAAVVVLVQGTYRFMGNSSYFGEAIADDPTLEQYPGAHDLAVELVDAIGTRLGPKATKLALVTYGAKVNVLVELGGRAGFAGAALGPQADYQASEQSRFIEGVARAMELLQAADGRRILVVFSDGRDVILDRSFDPDFLDTIVSSGIEVQVIGFDPVNGEPDAADQERLMALGGEDTQIVASRDDVTVAVSRLITRVNGRLILEFPLDPALLDGSTHQFVITSGDQASEPRELILPKGSASVIDGGVAKLL